MFVRFLEKVFIAGTRLPLWFLYAVSDILFVLVFLVFRYRRNIVRLNLKRSFPDANRQRLKKIERDFYRHFCDLAVESFKASSIKPELLQKRLTYSNPELIHQLYQQNKSIVLVGGHYGNWEWMLGSPLSFDYHCISLYHPLANKSMDAFIKKSRARFGSELTPMATAFRRLLKHHRENTKTMTYFIADQTPMTNARFWVKFLHQETAFFEGPAKIARKFQQAFVFLDIQKTKRGHYKANFRLLAEDASTHSEEELMFLYIRALERQIINEPAFWLWSHRRWKRNRPVGAPLLSNA